MHNFCIVDLGGFYLDVLKDRLYTMPTESAARRSAQTAMYHIAESMVRWLAPILSFTAEEIWQFLPGKRAESVFLTTWHALPEVPRDDIDWDALIELRGDVLRELEKLRERRRRSARRSKRRWTCTATPAEFARFNALGDELRFLFITSEARVHAVDAAPPTPGCDGAYARRRVDLREADGRGEVRALLASPRRMWARACRASRAVRALRRPTSPAWREEGVRMNAHRPQRLALAAADRWRVIVARSDHQGAHRRSASSCTRAFRVLPVLDITLVHNTGAAFSFLADAGGWQRWFFTALALGVSACDRRLAAAS